MIARRFIPLVLAAAVLAGGGCTRQDGTARSGIVASLPAGHFRTSDPLDVYTFQIDKARESGKWAIGEQWIAAVPAKMLGEYRRWFEGRAETFPPLWIYASARRMQETGNYLKAAFWYLVARERQIRQLRRCRDETAKEQLTWFDAAFALLRQEMKDNPELTRYAAKHAFAWLDLHEDTDNGLLAACLRGEKGTTRGEREDWTLTPVAARGGRRAFVLTLPPADDPAEWVTPVEGIHQIRTWSRILMKQDVAKILGEPQDAPPTPTVTPLR
ncbi:MAG TPA: hypothetical protein DCG48_10315 [Rhodospirillaceae bacterium]|nr:hypothetical protein [Rhodospirillaceae bacterium]